MTNLRAGLFSSNDNEIIAAGMADEVIGRTGLIHDFAQQHGSETQDIIPGYKAVDFLECIQNSGCAGPSSSSHPGG